MIELFERGDEVLLRVHASHCEELLHLVQGAQRLLAGRGWDDFELRVRATAPDRAALARLVERFGTCVDGLEQFGLTSLFPSGRCAVCSSSNAPRRSGGRPRPS